MLLELLAAQAIVLDSPSPVPPVKYQTNNIAIIAIVDNPGEWPGCEPKEGWVTRGCTKIKDRTIVMPNPCYYPKDYYARVLCHELGHINGWQHPPMGPEYEKYIKENGLTPPKLDLSPISRSPLQGIPHE
jgi:hypothetical protein